MTHIKPRSLGLGIVACLGLLSTALLAQQVLSKKPQRIAARGAASAVPTITIRASTKEDIQREAADDEDPAAQQIARNSTVSYHSLDELNAQFDGGTLNVFARVSLYETRPEFRYRWSLNVYHKETGRKLVARSYNKQIFSLPLGEISSPTFQEQVRIARDTYEVEIVVHAFPAQIDPAQIDSTLLNDPPTGMRYRILRNSVTVQP